MKKLEAKARFMRQFWSAFDREKHDLGLIREELLAERVALSVLKGGELLQQTGNSQGGVRMNNGTGVSNTNLTTEKALSGNEFSTSMSCLRVISTPSDA